MKGKLTNCNTFKYDLRGSRGAAAGPGYKLKNVTRNAWALAIGLSLILAACGTEPVDFTFLNQEPESIDPSVSSGVPDSRLVRALFCGLTSSHPETLVDLPEIASHWEISQDGHIWTFHLRETVWSDGTPLDASDFIWTYRRVLDPLSEAKFLDQFFVIVDFSRQRSS